MEYSAEIQEMLSEWRASLTLVLDGHDPLNSVMPSGRVVAKTPPRPRLTDADIALLLTRGEWTVKTLSEHLEVSINIARSALHRLSAAGKARIVGRQVGGGLGPRKVLWAA